MEPKDLVSLDTASIFGFPHVSVSDLRTLLLLTTSLVILRFVVAGAQHPKLRRYPTLISLVFSHRIRPNKVAKFSENLWYGTWHATAFLLWLSVMIGESGTSDSPGWSRAILYDSKYYYVCTPGEIAKGCSHYPYYPFSDFFRFLYLLEIAFWTTSLIYLGVETIRTDFYVMGTHHIVTIYLTGLSFVLGWFRIGATVFLLHNLGDIFLYWAKTFYYSHAPAKLIDASFAIFAFFFGLSRIVLYPIYCVVPSLDTQLLIDLAAPLGLKYWELKGTISLPICLVVLQLLHIFWFSLIMKMVIRAIRASTVTSEGDCRSDSSDDNPYRENYSTKDEIDCKSTSASSGSIYERRKNLKY